MAAAIVSVLTSVEPLPTRKTTRGAIGRSVGRMGEPGKRIPPDHPESDVILYTTTFVTKFVIGNPISSLCRRDRVYVTSLPFLSIRREVIRGTSSSPSTDPINVVGPDPTARRYSGRGDLDRIYILAKASLNV